MLWINGQKQKAISARDRGLSFGDGFFTTMKICHGTVLLLDRHIDRITDSAAQLGIEPLPVEPIIDFLTQQAQQIHQGGLKLVVTRGLGGQGYQPPKACQPSWIVSQFELPSHYEALQKRGISLGVSPVRLAAGHCYSRLKTLNRLEQVAIKRQLAESNEDDLICLDLFGNLVEASAANLFWRKGESVYTPDLAYAGIDGLVRQQIIAQLKERGQRVEIGSYPLDELTWADEIFITNCLMPILPVRQFNGRVLSDFSMTQTLLESMEPRL